MVAGAGPSPERLDAPSSLLALLQGNLGQKCGLERSKFNAVTAYPGRDGRQRCRSRRVLALRIQEYCIPGLILLARVAVAAVTRPHGVDS